jgi:streptomycin 6-kinase
VYIIPEVFARRMIEVYGDEGAAWLAGLPALLDACARRWGLMLGPPFALSYNYVAPAVRADGTEVVLKAGVPSGPGLQREIAALRLYNGHGITQLLDADLDQGVFLLERLVPGTMLADLADDAAATQIAAGVMRRLWRPVPPDYGYPFPMVADWAGDLGQMRARFGGTPGPFPPALFTRAERLFAALLPTMATPVLLHGDLHHFNILRAQREPWLAIDPKGVVGEPAYETGAFLRNPLDVILAAPDPPRLLARRVDQLAGELGLDRARILGWGIAQAVLSGWWMIEDHGYGWEPVIAFAEILAALPGSP